MSVETVAMGFIDHQMKGIVQAVYTDMYSVVAHHSRSGRALASIRIEKWNPNLYFVGAYIGSSPDDGGLHLYYLDEGNKGNGAGGRIYPTRSRALNTPYGPKASVGTYKGIHFVHTVASRHR